MYGQAKGIVQPVERGALEFIAADDHLGVDAECCQCGSNRIKQAAHSCKDDSPLQFTDPVIRNVLRDTARLLIVGRKRQHCNDRRCARWVAVRDQWSLVGATQEVASNDFIRTCHDFRWAAEIRRDLQQRRVKICRNWSRRR